MCGADDKRQKGSMDEKFEEVGAKKRKRDTMSDYREIIERMQIEMATLKTKMAKMNKMLNEKN